MSSTTTTVYHTAAQSLEELNEQVFFEVPSKKTTSLAAALPLSLPEQVLQDEIKEEDSTVANNNLDKLVAKLDFNLAKHQLAVDLVSAKLKNNTETSQKLSQERREAACLRV